jgi:hypothetical protein
MALPEEARLQCLFARVLRVALATPFVLTACADPPPSKTLDASVESGTVFVPSSGGSPSGFATSTRDACTPQGSALVTVRFDGGADLYNVERFPCGVPADIPPIDGGCRFSVPDCQRLCVDYGACGCRARDASCSTGAITAGSATIYCDLDCVGSIGRKPSGLVASLSPAATTLLGAYFATAAHLEAASVYAFEELGAALRRLGAPAVLVGAAARAARDERRHAAMTGKLAARFGGRPEPVRCGAPQLASALDVALDNAREGCVRETYGALVAHFQAARAEDAQIRRALATIAVDETRHAALAWAVARWIRVRLSPSESTQVDRAFAEGLDVLKRGANDVPRELVESAGVPTSSERTALLAGFERELFAASGLSQRALIVT